MPDLKLGNTDITTVKIGSTQVNKVYLGANLIWSSIDPDAQAFITAAGITDATQQSAINTLVTDLKGYGIWTKMKAIYPFVGGTSSTHKWNLKDPRDLDAAFRLVFSGGWTFSNTGALPNGVNAYGNTYLNSNTLTLNNTHISYYVRTSTINNNERDIGNAPNGLTPNMLLGTNTGAQISDAYSYNTNRISASITTAAGFIILSRINSTTHKLYKNGIQLGSTDTTTNTLSLPNAEIYIGAINVTTLPGSGGVAGYSTKQTAFASIGDGLTDTEAANLYTAVQAYQTTLSRNV